MTWNRRSAAPTAASKVPDSVSVTPSSGTLESSLRSQRTGSPRDAALMAKLGRSLDTLQSGLQTVVAMLNDNREPLNQTVASIRNTSRILEKEIAARIAQGDSVPEAALFAKEFVSDLINNAVKLGKGNLLII